MLGRVTESERRRADNFRRRLSDAAQCTEHLRATRTSIKCEYQPTVAADECTVEDDVNDTADKDVLPDAASHRHDSTRNSKIVSKVGDHETAVQDRSEVMELETGSPARGLDLLEMR